ncbi:MAG: transglycosylase domain-containing protein [Bacteroidia bacterium]|nr:transglycosylase domain-containing protein [Bacteroidia bacterium]
MQTTPGSLIAKLKDWLIARLDRIRYDETGRLLTLREIAVRWLKSWTWQGSLKLAGIGLGSIVGFVLLLWLAVALGIFGHVPTEAELAKIRNHTASEIYASDGVVIGKFFIENRTQVEGDEISPLVAEALIATEDARFFEHSGIDTKSMFRVIFKSVLLGDESSGGGSTISQQLAKNIFKRGNYAFLSMPVAKIKEMMIARRLERTYQKEDILTLYLNTVPFGENVYGIGAASQRFFSTKAKNLRIEDAAVLVGMLKANTAYNPRVHPERAVERRNVVLEQMEKYGYITPEERDSLAKLPMGLKYDNVTDGEGQAPYFRQYLAKELEAWFEEHPKPDGTRWNMYTDGLRIHTTIDSRLQRMAERAVKEHMKSLQQTFDQHWKNKTLWKPDDPGIVRAYKQSNRYKSLKAQGKSEEEIRKVFSQPVAMEVWTWDGLQKRTMTPLDSVIYYQSFLQAGMLVMEAQTGQIKAWVGGINYERFQYDHVTSKRQAGSTFKPFVYAAALETGVSPCEFFPNELVAYGNWKPGNSDGKYGGYYSLKGGLANSVNTVSAAIIMQIGVNTAHDYLKKFGFTDGIPRDPTIVLGTADVSLLDMVAAYSAFVNKGSRSLPIAVTKIEDNKGNLIVSFPVKNRTFPVISETTAGMITSMLEAVVDSGTGSRLRRHHGIAVPIGGKTGTTQEQTDGWFMGVTAGLVTGVWVGGEDRQVRFRSTALGQGASMALPICGKFLQQATQSSKYKKYFAPFDTLGVSALASMECPMYSLTTYEPDTMRSNLDHIIEMLKEKRDNRDEGTLENPVLPGDSIREARPPAVKRKTRWEEFFERKRNPTSDPGREGGGDIP